MLAERGDVQLAFCWAHVHRRFFELAASGPAPIASEVLERITKLYAVESKIRGRSADVRRDLRQEKSRPVCACIALASLSVSVGIRPASSESAKETISPKSESAVPTDVTLDAEWYLTGYPDVRAAVQAGSKPFAAHSI